MKRLKYINSWLQLLRVPNFPTVPGDPLAGFALASLGQSDVSWLRVLPVVGCSLLLYAVGMIWNDCADYEEDLQHRPQRPLSSGRIGRRTAFVVGVVLALFGVALAAVAGVWAFGSSLVLLGLVAVYDWGREERLKGRKAENLKGQKGNDDGVPISNIQHSISSIQQPMEDQRSGHTGSLPSRKTSDQRLATKVKRVISTLNMGACRGASFLLGAAAARPPNEWSLIVVMAAVGIMLYITIVSLVAADEIKNSFWSRYVGLMIRSLIVVQALLCAVGSDGGVWVGAIVLLGWPLSWWLAKRFYAS